MNIAGTGLSLVIDLVMFVLSMALFALPFYFVYKCFIVSHEQHIQNYRLNERIAKSLEVLAEKQSG